MAVTRPLKEGSVTTYQQKVALGFPDILASEMDADLDTIYAAWNGNVGTANLVDGSVTTAKLANDAVTSAKILDGTIATGDLADLSVTTAKIANNAVTIPKTVPGLAVNQRQAISMLSTGNVPAGAPVALAATPAMTIRAGASVLFVIQPIGHMQVTTGAVTVRFRMRVEQTGVTVLQWDALFNVPAAACPFNTAQVPLTGLYSSAGGSFTYTLFAEMQTTGGQWVLSGGTFTVAELV
jgi:hypothetical protein